MSSPGAVPLTGGNVPDGAGIIWMDDVQCHGNETRLIDCPANPLGQHNCPHSKDAGVRCESQCPCVLNYCVIPSYRSDIKKAMLSGCASTPS